MRNFKLFLTVLFVLSLTSVTNSATFVRPSSVISTQGGFLIIDISLPGTLAEQISQRGGLNASELTVRGMIDDRDVMSISRMIYLNYLDLSYTDLRSLPTIGLANMRQLTTVRLPQSIIKLGRDSFAGCLMLSGILLPDKLENIEAGAFYNCRKLSDINIVRSVDKVGKGAFENCIALSQLIIEGAPAIDQKAFAGCSALSKVVCFSCEPPVVHSDSFVGINVSCVLAVPADAVESYRSHPVWGRVFSQILVMVD